MRCTTIGEIPLALWVEFGAALALLVGCLSLLSPLLRRLLLLLRQPIHNPTSKAITTGAVVKEVVEVGVGVGWLLSGEMANTRRGVVRVSSFAIFLLRQRTFVCAFYLLFIFLWYVQCWFLIFFACFVPAFLCVTQL
jgi:hypothetical protein